MIWIVIGGGPEAQHWRKHKINYDRIITSNRGLTWCRPDVYWITDPLAIERYRKMWSLFDGEIISNADLGRPTLRWPYMNAGPLYHGRSSGILCCRVALARGAREIHMVGFQGHRPEDTVKDTQDRPWLPYGEQAGLRNIAMTNAINDMAEHYPHVTFKLYGPTLLEPAQYPNLELIDGPIHHEEH